MSYDDDFLGEKSFGAEEGDDLEEPLAEGVGDLDFGDDADDDPDNKYH